EIAVLSLSATHCRNCRLPKKNPCRTPLLPSAVLDPPMQRETKIEVKEERSMSQVDLWEAILPRLPELREQWKLKESKLLMDMAKMGETVVPKLSIFTGQDLGASITLKKHVWILRSPTLFDPDFIFLLEALKNVSFKVIYLKFAFQSCAPFRLKSLRLMGEIRADTLLIARSWTTLYDFPVLVENKKKVIIKEEYSKSMYSKTYLKVIKLMYDRKIGLTYLETSMKGHMVCYYLRKQITQDETLGPFLAINERGIHIKHGKFELSLEAKGSEHFLLVKLEND
ncbi:hypothetical protein PFISCL1PPCAC_18963, partial [Pristionchus fissidentatus]